MSWVRERAHAGSVGAEVVPGVVPAGFVEAVAAGEPAVEDDVEDPDEPGAAKPFPFVDPEHAEVTSPINTIPASAARRGSRLIAR